MKLHYFETVKKIVPGVYLPVRSTLVKTDSGNILISPIKFDEEEIAEIKAQGEIVAIVAPSLFHHVYVHRASEAFPKATVWGVQGLREKNKKVKWQKVLGVDAWPYTKDLETSPIEGAPELNEYAFFHKSSKTLLVVDLFFNVTKPKGLLGLVLMMFGTYKRFGISSFYKKLVVDRDAFIRSVTHLLEWDFEHIAMAHGTLLETGAKSEFKKALGRSFPKTV